MNEIKLEILRDMSLNNNGYADRHNTVANVLRRINAESKKVKMTEVYDEFKSLVEFGHLKPLGRTAGGRDFYCLPEHHASVVEMLKELNCEM